MASGLWLSKLWDIECLGFPDQGDGKWPESGTLQFYINPKQGETPMKGDGTEGSQVGLGNFMSRTS